MQAPDNPKSMRREGLDTAGDPALAPAVLNPGGSPRVRLGAIAMALAAILTPAAGAPRAEPATPAQSLSAIEVAPEGRLLVLGFAAREIPSRSTGSC